MFKTPDANGTIIPIESKAEPFESRGGSIKVISGSGLGIRIDPDYIKTHKLVKDYPHLNGKSLFRIRGNQKFFKTYDRNRKVAFYLCTFYRSLNQRQRKC